jgi:SAM-dependent methyltransferase
VSWFVEAFGPWYSVVYPHRDAAEADRLVATLADRIDLDGRRVLDVGCGAGRHLERFAAAGARPVGLDLSEALLAEARRVRTQAGGNWPLVRADMRSLPVSNGRVDGVTSLFTAFGYFDAEGDRRALAEVGRVLRPGGFHLLDFLNRERVLAHPNPDTERVSGDWRIRESRRVEDGRVVKRVLVQPAAGGAPVADYEERVTLHGRKELESMLKDVGLVVRQVWGEYTGEPYHPDDSSRLVLLSVREGE